MEFIAMDQKVIKYTEKKKVYDFYSMAVNEIEYAKCFREDALNNQYGIHHIYNSGFIDSAYYERKINRLTY